MFLLPIGHEDLSVRRLPWVTIGIALICTAIQVDACVVEDRLDAPLTRLSQDAAEVLEGVASRCANSWECRQKFGADPKRLAAGLRDHEIGDSDEQEQYLALEAQIQKLLGQHPVHKLGYRPGIDSIWAMLTSMFTHGGFMHLIGNMLFLYLVGTSIEDRWGRLRFLLFYLVGGLVAVATYAGLHWGESARYVGASGAIAAGMGAFTLLFATTKIRFFYSIFLLRMGTFAAPAWLVLPLWFLQQVLESTAEASGGGVAYSAHVGGFAFGAVAALAIRGLGLDRRFSEETDKATGGWTEDPLYATALSLADGAQDRAAMAKLSELLSRRPEHRGARVLMFELALRTKNMGMIQRYAPAAFAEWHKDEGSKILSSYRQMQELYVDQRIEERILGLVFSAARAARDEGVAEDLVRRLMRDFPRSAQIPKALWTLMELYSMSQKWDLEERCLAVLIRDFPLDPFAERARARMAERGPT
ncbi:MAG: rhomboid family intramembrane serine protease [Myxococcota bacterium]